MDALRRCLWVCALGLAVWVMPVSGAQASVGRGPSVAEVEARTAVPQALMVGRQRGAAGSRQAQPPRGGSEFWIPFGSLFVPGFGQYMQRAPGVGLAYTAVAVGGIAVSLTDAVPTDRLPRDASEQLAFEGAHVAFAAGALSAWDAFHRVMPAHKSVGRYGFLPPRESLGDLLSAPFDVRFLGRWTTWIELGLAGAAAGWILSDREPSVDYLPFRAHDGAFVASLSLNAAVGEEALFRGWLLPMLTRKMGGRFWLANATQAALFGAGHIGAAESFAAVITASAAYWGWVTRRNGWSIREAIFHHFWYDVIVATAELLDDRAGPVQLMPIRIRF